MLKRALSNRNNSFESAGSDELAIKRAFKKDLEVDVKVESANNVVIHWEVESVSGPANNDEREWFVFKNEDDAEKFAVAQVKADLDDDPSMFTESWLQSHLYMTETDIRVYANDDASGVYDGMDDDEILESYQSVLGEEPLINYKGDLVEGTTDDEEESYNYALMRDELIEHHVEYLTKLFKEDPLSYFKDELGYTVKDLLDKHILSIDMDEAAQDAVDTDGVDHFLDLYDGAVEDITDPKTKKTYLAYGSH